MYFDEDNKTEEPIVKSEPTKTSSRLKKIHRSSLDVIEKRERVPKPLFWPLLFHEIDEIKKKKAKARTLRKIIDGIGD